VDEQRDIAAKYKVMSIPTIYIFKDGKPVDKVVGARPKSDLEAFINNNI
jgi:thioredoxin 1